jgi:hypothetical protein
MTALGQVLFEYAEELNAAAAGTGLAYLIALRVKCLAAIDAGELNTVISTTIDGETTQLLPDVKASEMFVVVQEALRELRGDSVRTVAARVDGVPL